MPIFSDDLRGSRPWRLEFVEDRQHVARCHRDDVGLEVVDQLHLALGHAAGDRHHGAAELFRAVMHAEPAGEQAIAIGVVDDHAGAAARGADRARHHLRPHVDIGLGIADHDRLAGGAGGGVDADQFFARHREHVERVVVAQVGLRGEREFRKVRQLPEVRRLHAGLVERLPVMRDVVVGVRQRPRHPFGLQRRDLVAGRPLGRVHLRRCSRCLDRGLVKAIARFLSQSLISTWHRPRPAARRRRRCGNGRETRRSRHHRR